MKELNPSAVKFIVLHSSNSHFGSVELIDQWHREKEYDAIGYHRVIANCFADSESWKEKRPDIALDGEIFHGRSLTLRGAHAGPEWNYQSIGVCLIGQDGQFTGKQIKSAIDVCLMMYAQFASIEKVIGHYETGAPKTCPDLDMDWFRELLGAA